MTARDQDATWPYKMDKTRSYDENRLSTGVKLANVRIFEKASSEQKYKGMGTTIVSLYFNSNFAYVGHVGDSRVYFWRAGTLKQITEDHSLLNDYLKAKKLTPEEIEAFPHKNVIVRALGMKDTVQVDVSRVEPQDGDVFLLCSDGLSGMVPDPAIQEVLTKQSDLNRRLLAADRSRQRQRRQRQRDLRARALARALTFSVADDRRHHALGRDDRVFAVGAFGHFRPIEHGDPVERGAVVQRRRATDRHRSADANVGLDAAAG